MRNLASKLLRIINLANMEARLWYSLCVCICVCVCVCVCICVCVCACVCVITLRLACAMNPLKAKLKVPMESTQCREQYINLTKNSWFESYDSY